jgi:hypothetical protein
MGKQTSNSEFTQKKKKKLSGKEIILNNKSHLGKVNRLPSLVNSWSKVVNGWSLGEEREVRIGRFS